MKKPAKKYFTAESGINSIMLITKWLASGITVEQLAKWINYYYAKADNPDDKLHLGIMLSAIYYKKESIARRCSQLFGLKTFDGSTVAESSLVSALFTDRNRTGIEWLRNLTATYPAKEMPDTFFFPGMRLPKDMVAISDKIGAIREKHTGAIRLIAFCDCDTDILVDEEPFYPEDPPLYFTESSHFISPLWLLRCAKSIMNYLLRTIGYPPIHINLQTVFTHAEARLINRDEYEQLWADAEMSEARTYGSADPVPDAIPISSGKAPITHITGILRDVIGCVSVLFKELDPYRNTDFSDKRIAECCKKMGIFT